MYHIPLEMQLYAHYAGAFSGTPVGARHRVQLDRTRVGI